MLLDVRQEEERDYGIEQASERHCYWRLAVVVAEPCRNCGLRGSLKG